MNESAFVPAVNWLQAKVICCPDSSYLCYIFKQDIVVCTLKDNGYAFKMIFHAHLKGVNGLEAPPDAVESSLKSTVLSFGGDGFVRLWDLETASIIKAHNSHNKKSADETAVVTCATWSPADPNFIVSASVNGSLVGWHLAENVANKFGMKLKKITSIVACPTDATLVAVATNAGTVVTVRLAQNGTTVQSFRACDTDIVDMAWQPCGGDSLLAVTSCKGELSLWRSQSGRCAKKFRIAPPRGPGKPEGGYVHFFPLVWYDKQNLVTRRNKSLAALAVPISDELWQPGESPWRYVHELHKREFNALAKAPGGKKIWTAGSDRHIVACDFETGNVTADIGMMYGGGICVAVSPHDPNRIAFGSSDGCVRVWDVTQPTGAARIYSKNIRDRVMAIVWHPEKDNMVVYGTSVGRVGIIDVSSGSAILLASASIKPVYNLAWGPPLSAAPGVLPEFVLYALSDQKLFVYPDLRCQKPPRDVSEDLNLQTNLTDICWKPDFSLMAVGSDDGKITLFHPPSLSPCHVIAAQNTMVQKLAWHPQMTSGDLEISPYQDLLTCGSRDVPGDVTIFKISQTAGKVSSSVFAVLKGHKDFVQSLAWSPHQGAHLVTSSGDYTIQVWNVATQTPIANYLQAPGIMSMFAIWSPIDPDFIISGSTNFSVTCWKISTKTDNILPPSTEVKRTQSGKKKPQQKFTHKGEMATLLNPEDDSTIKNKNGSVKEAETMPEDESLAKTCSYSIAKFPMLGHWVNGSASGTSCYRLLEADDSEWSDLFTLTLIASDEVFENKLTQMRSRPSQPTGPYPETKSKLHSISLWQGELKEVLTKCIQDGGLTPSLVALAPSVSPRLWLEACQAYARQLRAQLRHREAADYFVAGQQVEEAVKTLAAGFLHLDALCLARLHQLGEDVFNGILSDYADILKKNGLLYAAAECYIYLKKYDVAAKVLAAGKEVESLCAAALAYKKAGLATQQLMLALQSLQCCILQRKPQLLSAVCDDHPEYKVLRLLKEISNVLQNEEGAFSSLWNICEVLQVDNLADCCSQIEKLCDLKQEEDNRNATSWCLVRDVALGICASEPSIRSKHILNALHASQIIGSEHLYTLCSKLRPSDTDLGVFSEEGDFGKSLRAFLCMSLVDRLYSHADEATTLLPLIKRLYSDLLDERSLRYHRAKVELAGLERSLSQLLAKKSASSASVAVTNGGKVFNTAEQHEDGASEEDEGESLRESVVDKSVDQDGSKEEDKLLDFSLRVENSEQNGLAEDMSDKLHISNGHVKDNAENESKVLKLTEDRQKLLSEIKAIEVDRVVIPNPMRSFCLLRNVCEMLQNEHKDAKVVLHDVLDKFLPLFV